LVSTHVLTLAWTAPEVVIYILLSHIVAEVKQKRKTEYQQLVANPPTTFLFLFNLLLLGKLFHQVFVLLAVATFGVAKIVTLSLGV
jgi:hypothetical protein